VPSIGLLPALALLAGAACGALLDTASTPAAWALLPLVTAGWTLYLAETRARTGVVLA
jgi:hypothetical protein